MRFIARTPADLRMNNVEIGPRLPGSDAGLQAPDGDVIEIADPAKVAGKAQRYQDIDFPAQLHRAGQLGGNGKLKRRRQHANNRVGLSVERDRAADNRTIGAKALAPDAMADDGDVRRVAPLVVGAQRASERRRHLQYVEQSAARAHKVDLNRLAGVDQVGRHRQILGKRLEGARLTSPLVEMTTVHRDHRVLTREFQHHFTQRHQRV